MHQSRKLGLCSALIFALAFVFVAGNAEAVIKIRASHGSTLGSATDQGWQYFKKAVEERSKGEIQVQIYPNNQLGSDRETSESVQLGNLQMSSPSTSILAPFAKNLFVLDMFFLFNDRAQVYKVLDGPVGKQVLKTLEPARFKGLGFMENGFRNLTNNKRPIRTPDDMQGMKIRVMENPLHLAAWKALNSNPTPMAFTELFTAMQQGTVDGQENPLELIYVQRFYEVQKYITMSGHVYTPFIVIMNKKFFDKLSPEHQELIQKAMDEAIALQRQKAAEAELTARKEMEAKGINFVDLTPEELNEFRKRLMPVRDLVKDAAGAEITEMFLKATEQ